MSIVSPDWLIEIDERAVGEHRVAVAELVAELDLDGNARPLLDGVLADHARRRPRCRSAMIDDAVDPGEHVVAERVELGDVHDAVDEAAAQGVGDRLRLLG